MELSVTISDFRDKLKYYLDAIAEGKVILLTKRGKVIARIAPEPDAEQAGVLAYEKRLKAYKKGGIAIHSDIVDSPLQEYDYLDDSLYDDPSLAAEPE